jgi:hypothetical protein
MSAYHEACKLKVHSSSERRQFMRQTARSTVIGAFLFKSDMFLNTEAGAEEWWREVPALASAMSRKIHVFTLTNQVFVLNTFVHKKKMC